MVELRHLRYFIAVAEELNFSRAAERLHMAQPPLSVAIRQLESEIGSDLFVRTSREVKLTAAGRVLLDGARRTLAEFDRTISSTRRAATGELGTLRVAFSWSARFATLPAIAQAFRERHPDVNVITEEMWNARMPLALRSGAIDLAISLCPEVDPELSLEPIRREGVVVLLRADHPLADESAIPLFELEREEFLMFPRELAPHLYDVLVSFCRRAGFEPRIRTESFHTGWDTGLLASSSVAALAPESVRDGPAKGVVAVPIGEPLDRLETFLMWHSHDAAPATVAFREVATALFAGD